MTQDLRRSLDRFLSQRSHVISQIKTERRALAGADAKVKTVSQAQALVQVVAEQVQASAHRQIASVVTRCLKAVFGDEAYQFRIDFKRSRGKTEAKLVFVRDGLVIDEPTNAAGGGVVDVAAFALRLACLVLSRPRKRKLLCLDEPFRFLSREHRPAVRELLLAMAEELKVQIVMVTHSEELTAGKVFDLS